MSDLHNYLNSFDGPGEPTEHYVTVRPHIGGPCPECGTTLRATYEPYECRCPSCLFWWDSYVGREVVTCPKCGRAHSGKGVYCDKCYLGGDDE